MSDRQPTSIEPIHIPELGRQRSLREVSELFEVAESTVKRYPWRYGGARFGSTVLFFDKLISSAI